MTGHEPAARTAPAVPNLSRPALSLVDVSKRYQMTRESQELKTLVLHPARWFGFGNNRQHWAVREVTFDVAPGEFFSIVGANGSGKSTLLRLVAGLARPTSGAIRVNGRISSLLELGSGFHPQVSGRENAILNGLLAGLTRQEIERLLPGIVQFAGLAEFIDQPMRTYSSGMHVRLGFAIAAFLEPEILLVDEVLAVGDARFQEKCFDHIAGLQAKGVTIVMVSHDLASVERFSSRAALMEHGRIVAMGDPHRIVGEHMERLAESSPEIRRAIEETLTQNPELLEAALARDPEAKARFEARVRQKAGDSERDHVAPGPSHDDPGADR